MKHVLLLLVLLVAGCGPERIPPPATPAPALGSPAAAIPADLDVAVRLDLERIRSALGQVVLSRLRQRAAESAGKEPELSRLMADLLLASDSVWIALRPSSDPARMDNVVILRGRFAEIEPRGYALEPPWGPPLDLGAGWRLYSRGPVRGRAEPARLYAQGNEVVVLVSTAEIDSVERQLEQRAGDEHVEPADKGVLSFAARAPALARWVEDKSITLARLLERGRKVSGSASLDSGGLDAELELTFEHEDEAQAVGDALGELAKSLAGMGDKVQLFARGLRVEVVGASVVLRLHLASEALAALTLDEGKPR